VSRSYPKILRNRKRRIERRLDPERRWSEHPTPMLSASNIHFEMAERDRAVNYGGIGAIHLMGQRLGLAEQIDGRVQLLKRHLPYHESDHVLNLAYNAPAELGSAARSIQRLHFSAIAGVKCFDDARGEATAAILGNGVRSGISLRRVRQHSAYCVGAEARRLRLGLSCLYRRFWRLHDLVWIIVGGD
jgi:hypothetical protein